MKMPVATGETAGGVMVKPGSGLVVDAEGYLSIDAAPKDAVSDTFRSRGDAP